MAVNWSNIFPHSFKEFLDPAGVFHDEGLLGIDLFNMDKTSDLMKEAENEAIKKVFEEKMKEAYEKGLRDKEIEAYAKYRTAGIESETAFQKAQSDTQNRELSKNILNAIVIVVVILGGFFIYKKYL